MKSRHPTGRSRHYHYHLHNFRDHQRPRYHPKYPRARPHGASRLRHLLSPHLLMSPRARRGLGNGHACQAPSIHIPTPLISHNNAQIDRAQKAPATLTHTILFHHLRLRRGSPRQRQMVNCQPDQSFRPERSLHSENHIDIVSRVGLPSRHEHIIVGRVIRCVCFIHFGRR